MNVLYIKQILHVYKKVIYHAWLNSPYAQIQSQSICPDNQLTMITTPINKQISHSDISVTDFSTPHWTCFPVCAAAVSIFFQHWFIMYSLYFHIHNALQKICRRKQERIGYVEETGGGVELGYTKIALLCFADDMVVLGTNL